MIQRLLQEVGRQVQRLRDCKPVLLPTPIGPTRSAILDISPGSIGLSNGGSSGATTADICPSGGVKDGNPGRGRDSRTQSTTEFAEPINRSDVVWWSAAGEAMNRRNQPTLKGGSDAVIQPFLFSSRCRHRRGDVVVWCCRHL
jgi:hypothetical protein